MRARILDHGDSQRWLNALSDLLDIYEPPASSRHPRTADLTLPNQRVADKTFELTPPVGIHGSLSEDQQTTLANLLQAFHPWRKGPWWLHGIHLDTEWRSDWKWQRLQPHLPSLDGARVLDVGSGNGYYGWQMLNAGAREVVGIDPTVVFVFQHYAMAHLLAPLYPDASNSVLPLRLEDLPAAASAAQLFDAVFSMGVLYHRRDHMAHLKQLRDQLRPGGTLVLETLVCESHDLHPDGRYARMRNVHLLPKPDTVSQWLADLGFTGVQLRDLCRTLPEEQSSTSWMTFESLSDSLDPTDAARTVEGHPAPVRACFVANWSP